VVRAEAATEVNQFVRECRLNRFPNYPHVTSLHTNSKTKALQKPATAFPMCASSALVTPRSPCSAIVVGPVGQCCVIG